MSVLEIKILISELARFDIQVKCALSMPICISTAALCMAISS